MTVMCLNVLLKSQLTGMENYLPLYGGMIFLAASYPFYVESVKVSVLSLILFNIYVDVLILELESSGYGCFIGKKFIGCVMHADDLLLLSASVCGLQSMLDICYGFGRSHLMIFNSKKSLCCLFGSSHLKIPPMKLGDEFVNWVCTFKYLGFTFISSCRTISYFSSSSHFVYGAEC